MTTDIPAIAQDLALGSQQAYGHYQEAPWSAKRMVLAFQLAKQTAINQHEGIDTSVMVYDITDGKQVYSHNTQYVHWAASLSKLFVTSVLLDEVRAGHVSLDTVVSWDAADRRAGAGKYDADGSPTSATIRDALFDMLNQSGNTAVRAIVNKALGGAPAVNTYYEQHYPQLQTTRLQPVSATGFLLGYTKPSEVDFILNRLYSQTDTYASFVKNALATNIFNDYGPRSQVKDPANITVIDKQGQLNDPEGNNRHDVGVIENARNGHKLRYVLMTTNYEQPAGPVTEHAVTSLQAFGRSMLAFEGDRAPQSSAYQVAPEGRMAPDVSRRGGVAAPERGRVVY